MKKISLFLILGFQMSLACAASPNPQKASSAPEVIQVIGTGKMSCGQFLEYQAQGANGMDLIVQWVWGFLVAYNTRGNFTDGRTRVAEQLNYLPDSPTVLLFIEQFCKKHPLQSVITATWALTSRLGGDIALSPELRD